MDSAASSSKARAIDFDQVAGLYDTYVSTALDLGFWQRVAASTAGPRLELMCGTGRIALSLLRSGIAVEGLDYSQGMLDIFRQKLAQAGLSTPLYHADARSFELPHRYGLIFIGFHSIAEVLDDADKLAVLRCVHRHLSEGGAFWISLHNPPARRATLDGRLLEIGRYELPGSGEQLRVTARFELDEKTGIVSGVQCYQRIAQSAVVSQQDLPVRFDLLEPQRLEALLGEAGFRVTERYGDYAGAAFSAATSPFYLAECRRR